MAPDDFFDGLLVGVLIGCSILAVAATTPWILGRELATGVMEYNVITLGLELAFAAMLLSCCARSSGRAPVQ